MRAIATILTVIVLAACSPVPTPRQSLSPLPTRSPDPTPVSSASPGVAAAGALRVTVMEVSGQIRTVGMTLVGRVETATGVIVADLGPMGPVTDVPLTVGSYRFVGETHGVMVSGMAPEAMGHCDTTFAVEPVGTATLRVDIGWDQPCSITEG